MTVIRVSAWQHFFSSLLICLLLPSLAWSAQVSLSWEASDSPEAVGYRVYMGHSSGDYSPTPVYNGTDTNCTVSGLELNMEYFFAATAYDSSDQESSYSNEVSTLIVDTDNDGLSDASEIQIYGTNANLSDTDGDGINDFDEKQYWGADWNKDFDDDDLINLLDIDSDNDTFRDGDERNAQTDPGNSSSKPDNTAPEADAGDVQIVAENVNVLLNGSNSVDQDGDSLFFAWSQISGPDVELSDSSAWTPSFTSPYVSSDGVSLKFQLTVTDEHQASDTDTCIVTITWNNAPPVADAGPGQNTSSGSIVTLHGSESTDPDDNIKGYAWTQTSGQQVTLQNAQTATPSFTAPSQTCTLTFELEVTDFYDLKSTDSCTVQVTHQAEPHQPPHADAGQDQRVTEGTTVQLNGSQSKTPEDHYYEKYRWEKISGPTVYLSDASSHSPTFVAPKVDELGAELKFKLMVTDENGLTSEDVVTIDVTDNHVELGMDIPEGVLPLPSYGETVNAGVISSQGAPIVSIGVVLPEEVDNRTNQPAGLNYPLFDFIVKVQDGVKTADVTFHFDHPLPENYVWYKYDSLNGWTIFENCRFSTDRKEVTLTLTDGGVGDHDYTVNGFIVDPSGPGPLSAVSEAPHSESSSGGGGGGGCSISTHGGFGMEWVLLLAVPLLLRLRRQGL